MDHQDLLRKEVLDDAEKRAQAALKRGEREAKKIRREAEKQAEAIRQAALEQARAEAEQRAARILATIPLEKKRRRLAAQEELIQEATEAAMERLAGWTGDARVALLARLLAHAAAALGETELLVEASEQDQALLDDALRRAGELLAEQGLSPAFRKSDARPALSAGVIVRSLDGRKLVDHSLAARRRRLEPEIRRRVARALFGDPGESAGAA